MSFLAFYAPGGFIQKTSTTTSDIQTAAPPAGARGFFINVATTDCRITWDGTTVSATNGLLVKAGQQPLFCPVDVPTSGLQILSTAAANSVVDIGWLK